MELKIELNKQELADLETIAAYQGKSVEDVAREAVEEGLKNFSQFGGPQRAPS